MANTDVILFCDKELTSIVDPDAAILGAIQNPELRAYASNLQKQNFTTIQDANVATVKSAYAAVYPDGKLSPSVAKKVQAVRDAMARLEESASLLKEPQYASWGHLFFTQLFDQVPEHVGIETFLHKAAFTLLFTQDVNGWTIAAPPGDVLAVDAKLFPALSYLNSAFRRLSDETLSSLEIPTFAALNEVLMPIVLYFTGNVSARSLPIARVTDLDSLRRSKAFGSHQTSFIIAHEIGHSALGHLRDASKGYVANRSGFSTAETAVEVTIRKQQDEFAADLYGYNAVRAKYLRRMQSDPANREGYLAMTAMLPTSIGVLFAYFQCIEGMTKRMRSAEDLDVVNLPDVEEHPEPKARMNHILQNNPFDLFWCHEEVELAWRFAEQWVGGINAIDDAELSALIGAATASLAESSISA
jgi:hypothetical protein